MISFISGQLVEKSAPFLVVEAGGIGYEVQASLATFSALPSLGSPVKLLTHFVVREDAQLLFGFADSDERKLFRAMIKVSGVGPKLALAILSGMDVREFNRCILGNDIKMLTRLPGVGKKTAERLVMEMKDRLPEWQQGDEASPATAGGGSELATLIAEAETALVALGYKPTEASKAIARVDNSSLTSAEALIRAALKSMISK